ALSSATTGDGVRLEISYDANGRASSLFYPQVGTSRTFTYGDGGRVTLSGNDAAPSTQLLGIGGTVYATIDSDGNRFGAGLGSLADVIRSPEGSSLTTVRNFYGNPTSFTDASGAETIVEYD